MMRPSSISATPVSSQELSIARTRSDACSLFALDFLAMRRAIRLSLLRRQPLGERRAQPLVALDEWRGVDRLGPHDEGVFVVVAVVTAAHPGLLEAIFAVQVLRHMIRHA